METSEFRVLCSRYAASQGWHVDLINSEAWFLKDGRDVAQAYLENGVPVGLPDVLIPENTISIVREVIRTEIFLPDHPQRQAAFQQLRELLRCSAPLDLFTSMIANGRETAPAADNSGGTFLGTDPDDPNIKFQREKDGTVTMSIPDDYLNGWKE